MSLKCSEGVVEHCKLIDDIILHEADLTEEAKRQFNYHTKILDIFQQNRRHVLINDKIAPIGRHMILSRLAKTYNDCKRVHNYAAANLEFLRDSLPSFGPLIICGLPRTGSTLL